MNPFPVFHSKILLFGEYSLLYGSMALSMPSTRFKGKLKFVNRNSFDDKARKSNKALLTFARAMKQLFEEQQMGFHLNTERLIDDLSKALVFESNIPEGYGLGSSGAVVAAVADAYAVGLKSRSETFTKDEIASLKRDFSKMESYFHGKSSGLDPLISFLGKPILVENSNSLQTVNISSHGQSGKSGVFLIDSGSPGETQPLVQFFNKQCEDQIYFSKINDELIPINNQCIRSFLKKDLTSLQNGMAQISQFTLRHLTPMVPVSLMEVWKRGLETGYFSLKLCGSGGGGMILGFTQDFEKAKTNIPEFNIEAIHTF